MERFQDGNKKHEFFFLKSNLTFLYKKLFSGRSILQTRMVNFSFSYIFCFLICTIFITVDKGYIPFNVFFQNNLLIGKKKITRLSYVKVTSSFCKSSVCLNELHACWYCYFLQAQTYKTDHSTTMKHFAHINCSRLTQFLFHVCVGSFTISDQQKVALQQFTQAFRIISVHSILMVRR